MADTGASRNGGYCFTSLTPTTAQQGSADEMWNMYLDEVRVDDKRIADAWKEGSSGILVFVSINLLFLLFISMTSSKTGLFSAIVAAFIIEFYKTLSPDSGDQTVALLAQISNQLANSPNGTYSNTANQSSPPSASMIWVISMWLMSLIFSLASALIASLLQEWARRYVETPNEGMPNRRARVRSFMFLGTELYKMRNIVQIGFSLLHFSVYLFFGGLVILFHTINMEVAFTVDVAVGVCGLAYFMLSILPCLDVACPYRTPMSYMLWYPLHAVLSLLALCLRWFLVNLHGCLFQPSPDPVMTRRQRILTGWLGSRGNAIRTHLRYITDGLGKNIINQAINLQEDGDRKIVARMFNLLSLGDKNKLRKFAASIPRDGVPYFIPLIELGEIVLREPLLILLRSCATGTHVAGPEEEERLRSLRVCLDAIHYIAKAPNVPDFNFVRANFANIGLMRALWNDADAAVRVTSRSICALLAKKVVRGSLEEPQLRWVNAVFGETPMAIYDASVVTRDRMNLKSFVYGVLYNRVDDLPTEDAVSFKETLGILFNMESDAQFDTPAFQTRLSGEVERIQQSEGTPGSREVVDKLRSMFPFLPPGSP